MADGIGVVLKGDSMTALVPPQLEPLYNDAVDAARTIIKSQETIKDLWAAFRYFDSNGDGSISFEELKAIMQRIRISVTDAEIFEMMNKADTNGDGEINFKEFVVMMSDQVATIKEIGRKLLVKSKSIRSIFKQFDTNYYGYLTTDQFRTALDVPEFGLGDLLPHEKDLVVAYCDSSEKSDGRIDYKEFFVTFFRWHIADLRAAQPPSSLRQVFVVTRHGTRFPLTPMPNNNAWPNHPAFWKTYGGKLTPKGIKEHTKLGQRLREHYMEKLGLIVRDPSVCNTSDVIFKPDHHNFPNLVHVFTSNTDRTLLSASGLLSGFCPSVAQAFALDGDADDIKLQGVRIHVADPNRKHTPIVHGYCENDKYAQLKDKASKSCPFFHEIAEDPEYAVLFAKLWEMTKHERIEPSKPLIQRFAHMSPVHQQIEIERSMKMNVLSNKNAIRLTAKDEAMMEEIADHGKRAKFQGNSQEEHAELARCAAGILPAHIIQSFKDRIVSVKNPNANLRTKKFVLYSAHDYTIMALLSQLGFRDWPIPKFTAHVVFELHEIDGDFFVRVAYNPNPAVHKDINEYQFFSLPQGPEFIPFAKAERGKMQSFAEFEDILMNVRRSFTTEEEWQKDADSMPLPEEKKKKQKKETDE